MSQHTLEENLISSTTHGAVGVIHKVADQVLPPAVDNVLHGTAQGVLDWADGATQPCQPCQPCGQPPQANVSPSFNNNQSQATNAKNNQQVMDNSSNNRVKM
ncbi:hypothetical protein SUGI_0800760 [Cryptomeria japonica]|nr:hypothetical protein SUGI_0800760 [Cryptomeria japonica]